MTDEILKYLDTEQMSNVLGAGRCKNEYVKM